MNLVKKLFGIENMTEVTQHKQNTPDTVFYCNALNGQSSYNICINCDMTVSCNCQDYDGSGQIGDLHTHSFEEIFRGGKAQQFREILARGEYPVQVCPGCMELRTIPRSEANHYLTHFVPPYIGIMVENTILCNLSCRFCERSNTFEIRKQKRMKLADMEQVASILKENHIQMISFHNLGEPFISNTVHKEIEMLIRYNPTLKIIISTNGAHIDTDEKVEAALLSEHLFISIDGPNQAIMAMYQVGGNFEKSYANLKRLVTERNKRGNTRPIIEWKYVVFNWNDQDEHIEEAVRLAKEAGVDRISFLKGGAPEQHLSTRYTDSAFFQNLGESECRGREIWFNGR